ncbi:hypothetical protein Emag_006078 [Eimeria magna]
MEDPEKGLRRLLGALERLQGRGSSEAAVAELRRFYSLLSSDPGPMEALLHDKACMHSRAAEIARRCCVGLYALLGSAAKGGGPLGIRLVTAQLLLLLTSLTSSSKLQQQQQQQQAGGPPPQGGAPLDLFTAFTHGLEGLSEGSFRGPPETRGPPVGYDTLAVGHEDVFAPWEVLAATPSGWGAPGGAPQKVACSAVLPSCLAEGPGSQMSLYSPNQLCCLLLLLLQLQGPHVLEANVKAFTHFVAGDTPSAAVAAAAAAGSTEQQQQQQQQKAPPASPGQLFAFSGSTKQQQQQQLAAPSPYAAGEGMGPSQGAPRGARPQLLAVRQLSLLCILRLLEVSPRPLCCFKEEIKQLEETFELLLLRCSSSSSSSSKKNKSSLTSDFFTCLCRSSRVSDEELLHIQLFASLATWILRVYTPQINLAAKHRVREEALFRLMHFGFLDKGGPSFHQQHQQQQQQQQDKQQQRTASREEGPHPASPTGAPMSPGGPPEGPQRSQGPPLLGPVKGLKGSFFRSVSRYCLRVLQQAELQQQQQIGGCTAAAVGGAPGGDSSSSSLRLGRNAFVSCAHLERQLVDAAALEAVRVLFLISPADRNIQQQAFAAIKRRRTWRYFPSIFIVAAFHPRSAGSLLRFLIPSLVSGGSYGAVLNALLDLPLTAAFLERWGLQGPPEGSCCPLLQAAARYLLRTEADGTLGLWDGRTQDELQRLLRLCEGLPATPRVSAVCKILPLSIDVLVREALEASSPEPRDHEQPLPLFLMRTLLSVSWFVVLLGLSAEVFRVLLSRFLLLYPLGFFEEDCRRRAVKALVALMQQDPTLLLQQQQAIVAAIVHHLSPKGAPLAQALCWAVGALLTPELLQQHQGHATSRMPSEIVTCYFEALEAVAYGAVAPLSPHARSPICEGPQGAPQGFLEGKTADTWTRAAASPRRCSEISVHDSRRLGPLQGPPGEGLSDAGKDLPPLLFCVCVAAIAHLALRFPPLRPRAVLCLTALQNALEIFPLGCGFDVSLSSRLWDWLHQSEQETDDNICPETGRGKERSLVKGTDLKASDAIAGACPVPVSSPSIFSRMSSNISTCCLLSHSDTLEASHLPTLRKPSDEKVFPNVEAGASFTESASTATASMKADTAVAEGGLVARGLLQRLRKSREAGKATPKGVEAVALAVSGPLD